jgi:short-subunit dehydrogenase
MKYALVSGGSKGIGFGIATALARRKFNLVLIARNTEDLNEAKTKLENSYPVVVETLSIDLKDEAAAVKVGNWCSEKKLSLSVLCNVTGIGGAADYLTNSLDDTLYMLRLNMEPAVALVHQLLPLLTDNPPAYILNVSSMAGFAPISVKNIYSASKSAMIFFSYSLRYQLKTAGISVSCLCPGPVFTRPDIKKETMANLGKLGEWMALSPEKIGEIAIEDTFKKKMLIVPGTINKIISLIIRALPRRAVSWLYYKTASRQKQSGVLVPSAK